MSTNKLHLIHQPENIDLRLKVNQHSAEELTAARSQETPESIARWSKVCLDALRSNDLMKLDAVLSYEPIISEEAYKQCLTELNEELLKQFAATQILLGYADENATDPVSKYFRLPVFHDLLAQLTMVNPRIYEQQFDLFLEVEHKTKPQDKLRVIRQEMLLPLSSSQKEELVRRREKVVPVVEDNDTSGGGWRLGLGIFLAVLAIIRLLITINRH